MIQGKSQDNCWLEFLEHRGGDKMQKVREGVAFLGTEKVVSFPPSPVVIRGRPEIVSVDGSR